MSGQEITIIIPAFNAEATIMRAISSVRAQHDERWHLIIVDDGSSDRTADIVGEAVSERITLISQQNQGVSIARNVGVNATKTEFVAFLDADDEWEPTFLTGVQTALSRHPHLDVVFSNYRFLSHQRAAVPEDALGDVAEVPDYIAFSLKYGMNALPSAICIRRQLLLDAGGFPAGVRYGEDLDTWARLAWNKAQFVFLPAIHMRYHDETVGSASNARQVHPDEYPAVLRTFSEYSAGNMIPQELRESAQSYARYRTFWHIMDLLEAGHTIEARAAYASPARVPLSTAQKMVSGSLTRLPAPVGSFAWRNIRNLRTLLANWGLNARLSKESHRATPPDSKGEQR